MAERPAKRTKLLFDSESEGSDNEGVKLPKTKKSSTKAEFKINDEFAKRFEHNNKRTDLERLEARYGKGAPEEESDESSTDESEDDDADLVTADALEWRPESRPDAILLDAPCSATGTIRIAAACSTSV